MWSCTSLRWWLWQLQGQSWHILVESTPWCLCPLWPSSMPEFSEEFAGLKRWGSERKAGSYGEFQGHAQEPGIPAWHFIKALLFSREEKLWVQVLLSCTWTSCWLLCQGCFSPGRSLWCRQRLKSGCVLWEPQRYDSGWIMSGSKAFLARRSHWVLIFSSVKWA